jgi:hypothetical protein
MAFLEAREQQKEQKFKHLSGSEAVSVKGKKNKT